MGLDPTLWSAPDPRLRSLDRADDLVRQITEYVRDVFWLKEPGSGRMLYVSPAYQNVWGRTVDSLYAAPASFLDSIHPDDRDEVIANLGSQLTGGYDVEYRVVRPDGTIRWVRDRAFPIADEDGIVGRVAGIAQDVTERRKAVEELQTRERWYRTVFEETSDLITVFDAAGQRRFVNPSVEKVLGYEPSDLVGTSVLVNVHPDDRSRVERLLTKVKEDPEATARAEYRLLRKDGTYGVFEGVAVAMREGGVVETIVVCARDVTSSRFIDPLTGLPNENLLTQHLELFARRSRGGLAGFSLVVLGLDRFRSITSLVGEPAADQLLVEVARRLRAQAPEASILARIHGDLFAAILQGVTGLDEVLAEVSRLEAGFGQPFASPMGPLPVTAGFGILVAPPAEAGAGEILRDALEALASAKRLGHGRQEVFDESMRRRAMERLDIENGLRRALQTDELLIHYQPIFDMRSGRLAGFEALARWDRPGAGLLPPASFIPVAEASDLICELDLWVFRRAARQIVSWRERFSRHSDLFVSVNLSGRHFQGGSLADRVKTILAETGAPPAAIRLEITEGVLMKHGSATSDAIELLREDGLRFALDDFGTGYSSLAALHRYRFETLKIDGSFVMSLGTPSERPELVRAIIGMAHTMGLGVVAEGVETAEQLAFLRRSHCEFGQGYGLGRPMDEAQVEALLRRDPIV